MKTVGKFTLDEKGNFSGPKDYMKEKGDKKLDAILAGEDTAFNIAASFQPDVEMCILVMMQTDYAGWLGNRQFAERYGIK